MPRTRLDIVGKIFNYITVIEDSGQFKKKAPLYKCICICGNEFLSTSSVIFNGAKKSCGCKRGEQNIGRKRPDLVLINKNRVKHSDASRYAYSSWKAMLYRCINPKSKDFYLYGGRGILVCDRWMNFELFFADMGVRPKGMTIDRIDVNGNYEPLNCKWATPKEQARNTRTNVNITYNGATKCIAEWADESAVERKALEYRIRAGWNAKKALTTPSTINRK